METESPVLATRILAGVIGDPIAHSLSPKLHGWWLERYRVPGEYAAWRVTAEELGAFLASLPERGIAGVSVTMPHKETIIPHLDFLDEAASMIGAVNTVVVKDGKLYGRNTDVYGFVTHLQEQTKNRDFRGKKAVILGAGGAARAICAGLLGAPLSFRELVIINRTREKAERLKEEIRAGITAMLKRDTGNGQKEISSGVDHFVSEIIIADWEDRENTLKGANLLVNTTSLGMKGHEPLLIDISNLPNNAVVYDIVTNPQETALLQAARARALPAVDGLGMLLHQAAPAFKAWYDPEDRYFSGLPEVTQEMREFVIEGIRI